MVHSRPHSTAGRTSRAGAAQKYRGIFAISFPHWTSLYYSATNAFLYLIIVWHTDRSDQLSRYPCTWLHAKKVVLTEGEGGEREKAESGRVRKRGNERREREIEREREEEREWEEREGGRERKRERKREGTKEERWKPFSSCSSLLSPWQHR